MLDVSLLYCKTQTPGTPHRYGKAIAGDLPRHQRLDLAGSARRRRPIVVWNITRSCNLACMHCYSDSACRKYPGELSTSQCLSVLDDLAEFGVPAVLFSGGEPLMRPDLLDLIEHGRRLGLHIVVSTNGTLITPQIAAEFARLKVTYVGVSLDSPDASVHDEFRQNEGAFAAALAGIRNCVNADQKVGLRLTLTPQTCADIPGIFRLIQEENINRACFYHLCPSGRGAELALLSPSQTRHAIDEIFDATAKTIAGGKAVEILTVDNHCDGPYLYLRMLQEGRADAVEVLELLKWNGGAVNSSGVGIGNIDFTGAVHPDQFSMHHTLGNVTSSKFSQIWTDEAVEFLADLRRRRELIVGRCATCRFFDACGGSLRARAELLTGKVWASDPACYLTDQEIGI